MHSLLPIHNCVQVAFENEKLLKFNSILIKENDCLFEQVENYKKLLNRDYKMIDTAVQVNMHTGIFSDQVSFVI
jgi:hypothetical protein